MWEEKQVPETGEKYWDIEYHETDVTFGAIGYVDHPEPGRFEASVQVCTDGGTFHVVKKAEFGSLDEAQQWCDSVWNAPENLPIRMQMCQMEILNSIDQALYELLELARKRQ